jgi:hypothetical protein
MYYVQVPGSVILNTFGFDIHAYWNDVYALAWATVIMLTLSFIVLQLFVKERAG